MSTKTTLRQLAIVGASAVIGWLGTAREAQAQTLRPSTRPFFADLGLGPSLWVTPGVGADFKLSQEFGYHFSGEGTGPAIGAEVSEAFGSGPFRLQVGPKFWWDIPLYEDCLFITPSAKLGYAVSLPSGGAAHAFNWSAAAEVRLVLIDRVTLFARPIAPDFFAGEGGFAMAWDIMAGGGVTF